MSLPRHQARYPPVSSDDYLFIQTDGQATRQGHGSGTPSQDGLDRRGWSPNVHRNNLTVISRGFVTVTDPSDASLGIIGLISSKHDALSQCWS